MRFRFSGSVVDVDPQRQGVGHDDDRVHHHHGATYHDYHGATADHEPSHDRRSDHHGATADHEPSHDGGSRRL